MMFWLHVFVLTLLAWSQPGEPTLETAQRQIDAQNWRAAQMSLESITTSEPGNFRAYFGLACVRAQLDDIPGANGALMESITQGYSDFWDMQREPLLTPIHDGETWKALLAGWTELLDARGETDSRATRQSMGKSYRTASDDSLRLKYVHAYRDESFALVRNDVEAIGNWARASLFDDALDVGGDLPDPWVTLLLPKPEDFVILVGAPNIGGYYDHDAKRLIAMDLGPTLAHEFLHVLHWRVMTRAGQRHPDWIMEALGALIEDIDLTREGELAPVESWRTNIAKRRLKMNRLMDWSELFTLKRERFRSTGAGAPYAQARAVALYLWQRGTLAGWFSAYLSSYNDDPSGALAFEIALGEPNDLTESDFRDWLRDLPWAPEGPEIGDAWMAVDLSRGRGDGPRIEWLHPGSPARRAGLRMGDVPVRIDGKRVWTREDVYRLIGGFAPGESVAIEVRRGRRFLEVEVLLVEFDG